MNSGQKALLDVFLQSHVQLNLINKLNYFHKKFHFKPIKPTETHMFRKYYVINDTTVFMHLDL